MLNLNTVKQDAIHNSKSVPAFSTDKKNKTKSRNVIQVVREQKTLGSYQRIYVYEVESICPSLSGEKGKATLFGRFCCQPLTQRNLQGVQFIVDVLLTFGIKKDSQLTSCCLICSNADIKRTGRNQCYSVVEPSCYHCAIPNLTTVPTGTHRIKSTLLWILVE